MKKVGVVGFTGVMGAGIVQLCAQSGYAVVGFSRSPERMKKAMATIEKHLSRLVEKEKIAADERQAVLARIATADTMTALGDCDLVIESAVENMELKKSIFAEMDAVCRPDAILATNTSSLSIIDLAMATRRPNQVLGLHFFNPAPLMPLLEVVRTIATSDETLAAGKAFGESLGKTIIVARDAPGYIVNTLLIPYLLNAIRMLDRGQAAREDIDTAIKAGLNYPMGPLQVADYIGLDALLFIANIMYEESKEPQYAAPPLLKKMVTAGWLGRKSGKGFYEYR
ncbi:3-hydroxyacyl-CoA dehydrogenase family protein [Dehalogenimonas alkenigignens]|uniref:3-hydroxyacyl-CoA dehydrogenase family protein n=1 Tax=Dehalogenimonas alkenigignens TaxID=1217799 RepID=UPI0007310593|nr:3-hydroxybutyryl-CoA dehydrogenase [Dehalogenimonas alkenigignens]PVV84519.1 3-hydroxybutyryl-CoA dehydrogenase [Dehalogenimonas alkenigignens]